MGMKMKDDDDDDDETHTACGWLTLVCGRFAGLEREY
jgi:hypothetical protein